MSDGHTRPAKITLAWWPTGLAVVMSAVIFLMATPAVCAAETFSGKLEIHFRPSTRCRPPIDAGSAMIRDAGRSGKRKKYDGGFTESPVPCSR